MTGDFDPRDLDSRERDDGIHDREDQWLTIGRGPGLAVGRDGDEDVRDCDDDWREEREREPRDRETRRRQQPRPPQCVHARPGYAGREITGKTEAERFAEEIRRGIRAGTFRGLPAAAIANEAVNEERHEVSFEMFARRFVERYSKDRGKASWQDDEYMVKRLGSFQTIEGLPLGEKSVQKVTEDDLEPFIKHLTTQGRATAVIP